MFKFYKPECFIPDISTALSSNYQITKFEKLSILISAQWGRGRRDRQNPQKIGGLGLEVQLFPKIRERPKIYIDRLN
jgi:hypothetical protein